MTAKRNDGLDLPAVMQVNPATRRLKIAVVYSRSPFPMMRGDQLTVSHLLGFLNQRGHLVDFITLNSGGEMTPEQSSWLDNACEQVHVFPWSWFSTLLGAVKSMLLLQPLQVGFFYNRSLQRYARDQLKQGVYDIVYVYYLRSAPVIPDLFRPNESRKINGRDTAAFLAMQLSQTLNTRRIYNGSTGLAKKLFYFFEWKLLQRYEARVWQKFSNVMLIGEKDVKAVEDACRDENQPLVSNWKYGAHGTDIKKFRMRMPEERVPGRVVFSGSMLYQPNVQAVLWFVKHCWGSIRVKITDATLYIVGRDPVSEIQALDGQDGITVTGTVDDVSLYIRSASVCINPMLAAGGMQNKLIEYLASAVPVVATNTANEGIKAPDGQALLIRDEPEAFSDAVASLLIDPAQSLELGQNAREFVELHWTWEAHFMKLESDFYSALDVKSPEIEIKKRAEQL